MSRLTPVSSASSASASGARGRRRDLPLRLRLVRLDVRPWRFPPDLDFQYGDWFRPEFGRGDLAPWSSPNPDLAVVLAIVLRAGESLFGPPAAEVLDPIPQADLARAMLDGIQDLLADLESDTRNVILTLARIWTTMATGMIGSKNAAADWVLAPA